MTNTTTTANINEFDNFTTAWPSSDQPGGLKYQLKITKLDKDKYLFRGCTFTPNEYGYYIGFEPDGSATTPLVQLAFNIIVLGRDTPDQQESPKVFAKHDAIVSKIVENQVLLDFLATDMVKLQDDRLHELLNTLNSPAYAKRINSKMLDNKFKMAEYFVFRDGKIHDWQYLNKGHFSLVASEMYLNYINFDESINDNNDLFTGFKPEHYSDVKFERQLTNDECDFYADLIESVATGWTWSINTSIV